MAEQQYDFEHMGAREFLTIYNSFSNSRQKNDFARQAITSNRSNIINRFRTEFVEMYGNDANKMLRANTALSVISGNRLSEGVISAETTNTINDLIRDLNTRDNIRTEQPQQGQQTGANPQQPTAQTPQQPTEGQQAPQTPQQTQPTPQQGSGQPAQPTPAQPTPVRPQPTTQSTPQPTQGAKPEPKAQPKPRAKKENLLADSTLNFAKTVVTKGNTMDFQYTEQDRGKTVTRHNVRTVSKTDASPMQAGTYVTSRDLIDSINNKFANVDKNKYGEVTLHGQNGKSITVSKKGGKELGPIQRAKLNHFLAKNTSELELPSEKQVLREDKNGWLNFEGTNIQRDQKGRSYATDAFGKVQLNKGLRETFLNDNKTTKYHNISGVKAVATVKSKKQVPGWVKGVAVGAGIAAAVGAGLLLTSVCAPAVMPAISTFWNVAAGQAGIQSALHGVNVALANIAPQALSYASVAGTWTNAAGTIINVAMPTVGQAIGTLGLYGIATAAVSRLGYKMGKGLIGKVFGINKENSQEDGKAEQEKPDQKTDDKKERQQETQNKPESQQTAQREDTPAKADNSKQDRQADAKPDRTADGKGASTSDGKSGRTTDGKAGGSGSKGGNGKADRDAGMEM